MNGKMRGIIFYRDAHNYYNSREVDEENFTKNVTYIIEYTEYTE